MPRTRILAIVTACACAAVPAAVLAAKPAATSVTIGIAPVKVTFGKPATVSGTTAANTVVTLRGDAFPFNGAYSRVASTTSSATGAYSFSVTPTARRNTASKPRATRDPSPHWRCAGR